MRADGTVTGGAMYYVPDALRRVGMPRLGKFLAGFFCVAAVGGSLTIFQVNQAYTQFHAVTGFDQASCSVSSSRCGSASCCSAA